MAENNFTTTTAGMPVPSDEHSLTVGPNGPILLQDHHLIEKMAQFNHAAFTLHAQDDDWGQAGTLVHDVLDDAARARLADNIVGHLCNRVSEPVLLRAFEYRRNVDKTLGDEIEADVRGKQGGRG